MPFRKFYSVQQKMTGIIFLISTIVLILSSALFVFIEVQRMHKTLHDDISSLSSLISVNVHNSMRIKDFVGAESLLSSLGARKDIVSSYLLLPNGRTVAGYSRSQGNYSRIDSDKELQSLETEARQIAEGLKTGTELLWHVDGRLTYFAPISFEGSHLGYNYISLELTALRRYQLSLVFGWLLVVGPAVLLTYWLSVRLQKHISGPIEQLVARMGQISREKRLVGFVPKETDDEFGQLFHGFDEMMRALKDRDQKLENHRKELELEVQVRTRAMEAEKEKAEHATAAKSRFLANMSHEIRTPMIGVLGMADVLRQKKLDEQDHALVETIYRSGEALLAILNDVLDFSKIEAGRIELESTPVDLVKLIEDVTCLLEVNAHDKGIDIIFNPPTEIPVVMGDPGRIRQILLNLIGNAIKFTEVGKVSIALSLNSSPKDEVCHCLFVIQDTGIGIPQHFQTKIFESFDQGESGTARAQGGTGLGLAITSELVQLMSGQIKVESCPGKGSTFSVSLTLPLAAQTDLPAVTVLPCLTQVPMVESPLVRDVSGGEGGRCASRVLLAEDNPTTQSLISILLEQMGIELHIVDDGQAALDFLACEEVDLVLMDCQMPRLDGFDATSRLRARGLTTPIIALTAYARAEDEQQCLAAGMSDFLCKPFRQSELKAVLEKWLGEEVFSQARCSGSVRSS